MKSMEQLEKVYEKEMRLSELHKKNAEDVLKQMEYQRQKAFGQKIKALNMNSTECDRLLKLLASGKKTVMEAVEIVLGSASGEPAQKGDEGDEKIEAS